MTMEMMMLGLEQSEFGEKGSSCFADSLKCWAEDVAKKNFDNLIFYLSF